MYKLPMSVCRHGSHTKFMIRLHLVWITKCRKPVMLDAVAYRVRDILREVWTRKDVDIIKGHVSQDHVHLFVSIPPQVTPLVRTFSLKKRRRPGRSDNEKFRWAATMRDRKGGLWGSRDCRDTDPAVGWYVGCCLSGGSGYRPDKQAG